MKTKLAFAILMITLLMTTLTVFGLTFYALRIKAELKDANEKVAVNEARLKKQLLSAQQNKSRAEKLLSETIDLQSKYYSLIKKSYDSQPNDLNARKELATAYGNFAYYEILNGNYSDAINYSKKGIEVDTRQEWINRNLAIAYLLNNQYSDAQHIYELLKSKSFEGISYSEILKGDLMTLENEDITHPDFDKFYKLLAAK